MPYNVNGFLRVIGLLLIPVYFILEVWCLASFGLPEVMFILFWIKSIFIIIFLCLIFITGIQLKKRKENIPLMLVVGVYFIFFIYLLNRLIGEFQIFTVNRSILQ